MKWLVVKFMPDLRRREPRNVGIVLFPGDRALGGSAILRLRGLTDGRLDLRRASVGSQSAVYEGWVNYWRDLAATEAPLERWLEPMPASSFYLEQGGEVISEVPRNSNMEELADDLYELLVEPIPSPYRLPHEERDFVGQVDDILRRSGLLYDQHFRTDFSTPLQGLREQKFHYAWVNGHTTVGQRLNTWKTDSIDATALRLALLPAGYSSVVIVPDLPTRMERALPLERVSHIAAVDDVSPSDLWEMFTATEARAQESSPATRLAALSNR